MNIFFAKTKKDAKIPTRELSNAGFDIYPCFDEEYIIIFPNETKIIPTGISSSLPVDYYFQIQERGSSGSKGIKYSAGVIDSNYRGEWFLAATNCNSKPILISKLDFSSIDKTIFDILNEGFIIYPYEKALFQAVIHCVHNELTPKEISFDELKAIPSIRGDGKLGSSNK